MWWTRVGCWNLGDEVGIVGRDLMEGKSISELTENSRKTPNDRGWREGV